MIFECFQLKRLHIALLNGQVILSHVNCKPNNLIESKLYRGRLSDLGTYCIVFQRINKISYLDETGDLHP